jgi:hypothetical protein
VAEKDKNLVEKTSPKNRQNISPLGIFPPTNAALRDYVGNDGLLRFWRLQCVSLVGFSVAALPMLS